MHAEPASTMDVRLRTASLTGRGKPSAAQRYVSRMAVGSNWVTLVMKESQDPGSRAVTVDWTSWAAARTPGMPPHRSTRFWSM